MPQITLLALPETLTSSLSLPMEMLSAADQLAQARQRSRTSPLRRQLVGIGERKVTMASGMRLELDALWHEVQQTDLLIVPALWRNPIPHLRRHRELLPWLRELAGRQTLLCAVGTGSFLLAEAGLLDHRPATTHWFYFDQFEQRYPAVQLKRQHLITGDANLYCAGSVNSVADLTIHFIERFYGNDLARHVEAQFSPEIRRPFATHAFSADVHGDELIQEAQAWLQRHYAEEIKMPALARQLGISLRSLNRRFRQATGTTPIRYLQQQRLHGAKELLRTTDLGVAEVALAAGFGDSDYFCRLFRTATKMTPRVYRRAVRGKLFALSPQERH
jgi:transcriptional regulator GlxA family with amidase domain